MKTKKKGRKGLGRFGILDVLLLLLQAGLAGFVIYILKELSFLDGKLLQLAIAGVAALLVLELALMLLGRVSRIVARILALILAILLGLIAYFGGKAYFALKRITDTRSGSETELYVYVLKENLDLGEDVDPEDYFWVDYFKGKSIGIQRTIGRKLTDRAISSVKPEDFAETTFPEFDSYFNAVEALYAGEVDSILVEQAYVGFVQEYFEDFGERTALQHTFTVNSGEIGKSERPVKYISPLTTDPFVIYLCGKDDSEELSDVNILAFINPVSKQILLLTTPRDYNVEIAGLGIKDKLTHSGYYGTECTMQTLANFYDVEIEYYARVFLQGFVDIVDALGGVDYYNDEQTYQLYGFDIIVEHGENHFNGEEALAFVRDRQSAGHDDRSRGKHQMQVLTSLINKALSPQILLSYSDILDAAGENFSTNIPMEDIGAVVKMQLKDGASWNITSYSVDGYGTFTTTHVPKYNGWKLYVMEPYKATVTKAKAMIQQVLNGETVTPP